MENRNNNSAAPSVQVTEGRHLGLRVRTIHLCHPDSCKSLTLPPGEWSYDAIVDALVTAEYPTAKMQAIVNNYLATPDDPDIRAEFDTMQSHRKASKLLAKQLLEEYDS